MCPFDTDSEGKCQIAVTQSGNDMLDIQQKQDVCTLQHNGMLKHKLYETPDAQAQTYKAQSSNKNSKYMNIFSRMIKCLTLSRQVFAIQRFTVYTGYEGP